MSMVTFAMPTVLDGPAPEAPPHALLSVPGVLVEDPGTRWQNGASIYGYPVSEPDNWDPCSSGTFRVKSDGEAFPTPVFASFVAYLPISCTSMSIGDPDEFRDRARTTLAAVESFAVERALSQGVSGLANPFFDDAAVDILAGGAAVTPDVGLAYLEDAIGETGRRGMIHATPAVGSMWFGNPQRAPVPFTTALGTPVAVGGGYAGSRPTGGSAAAAGQAWAYATGPVEVRHAEVDVLDIRDVLDRETNDVTFRAERAVLATWDTALQAAVLIDWTP
jgi:hypothetical protein